MLILSRKIEQCIIINGDIVVKILSVDRDAVKLGIDAPEEVVVNREEIQRVTKGRPKRRALRMVEVEPVRSGNKPVPDVVVNGHERHES